MSGAAIVLIALSIAVCADEKQGATRPLDRPPSPPSVLEWHNESTGQTILRVSLGSLRLGETEFTTSMYRWYRGKGRMGSAYGPATLLFDSRPSQVAPKYRDNRGAVINADGQAVKLGTVEYESNPGAVPTRVFIRVNIPDDEALLRLSKAHMIDGTVGMNRFRLSPAQLEGLQDFVRHVLDPQLPVNRPPAPSRPAAKVGPDRNTIPKGQGILHFGDGKRPCSIVPDLRSLDEIDEIVSAGTLVCGFFGGFFGGAA